MLLLQKRAAPPCSITYSCAGCGLELVGRSSVRLSIVAAFFIVRFLQELLASSLSLVVHVQNLHSVQCLER